MDLPGHEPGATQLTLALLAFSYRKRVGEGLQKLRKRTQLSATSAAGFRFVGPRVLCKSCETEIQTNNEK
jgi:hypothetical protein